MAVVYRQRILVSRVEMILHQRNGPGEIPRPVALVSIVWQLEQIDRTLVGDNRSLIYESFGMSFLQFYNSIQSVFIPTPRGIVGAVDDILRLCHTQNLELEYIHDRCRIRPFGTDSQESIDISIPKSVFRAMIARVATLCNTRDPKSVPPYAGEGELVAACDGGTRFHVRFENTPDNQRLEIVFQPNAI